MLCVLLVLLRDDAEVHTYKFGDPTKMFPAGKYENRHISFNLVRNCFGPEIDGSKGFTMKDQVLTFHEEHRLIKALDVFVEPEFQGVYEVEQVIDAKTFTVRKLNPMEVFTRVQMKTNMLIRPREFEGLVKVDVTGMRNAMLEYEVTPSEDILFRYIVNETTPNTTVDHDIFSLSVDVIGFSLALRVSYKTWYAVIPILSKLMTRIEYERQFHHETFISGVIDRWHKKASWNVVPRSYLKRSSIQHEPCRRLTGTTDEFNFSVVNDIVFDVWIGDDRVSVVTTSEYQIRNYFVAGDYHNNTLAYDISMTTQRRVGKFQVGEWVLWDESPGTASSVVVPQPQRRVDIVRNESLVILEVDSIPQKGETLFLYPSTVYCNVSRRVMLRFDIFQDGSVIDSLLLEPMTFGGSVYQRKQGRIKHIEPNSKAVIKVLVRDLYNDTSEYLEKQLTTDEGVHTVCGDQLCIDVEIGKAYEIMTDVMYQVNNSAKYVYFVPPKIGLMGFSVIKKQAGTFYANSLRDMFHTPSLLSESEQSVFWNWITIDVSFRDITFPETVKSVDMSINVNRGTGTVQNVYQMRFTKDRILDDHVLFQMQNTWSLQIYVTVTELDAAESTLLFKFSYKQIFDMIGSHEVFRAHGCNVTLEVSQQEVYPIVALEDISVFVISPVWDFSTKAPYRKSQFTVARIAKDDVNPTGPWPLLKAMLQTDTIVLSKLSTVEGASIVDLEPGVNIRYVQDSLVISLPMLTLFKEFSGFDAVLIFASSEDCYCDRYDNITSQGPFDVGCLEFNETKGIQVWSPLDVSYTSEARNLGTAFTLSMARMTTPVSSVNCSLRNIRIFPSVATVIDIDWDARFQKLSIQCERCDVLQIGNGICPPDVAEPHTFSVPRFPAGTPIRALCPTSSGAYCIQNARFKESSLVVFPTSKGIESYTLGFDTVFGISQQVVEQEAINYSQKTNGSIHSSAIGHFDTLALEIEVNGFVFMTGYANTKAIPFSAPQMLADPRLFFAEFGCASGLLLEDGRVSCDTNDFLQPALGEYDVNASDLINLTRIFGFNHSRIATFIVRCSKGSPLSEDGKCLPVQPQPPSFTASTWFTPNDPGRKDYGVIIGFVITGVFLIGLLTGVLLFLRKKRKTEMSASEIIEKHLLEDCSFAI